MHAEDVLLWEARQWLSFHNLSRQIRLLQSQKDSEYLIVTGLLSSFVDLYFYQPEMSLWWAAVKFMIKTNHLSVFPPSSHRLTSSIPPNTTYGSNSWLKTKCNSIFPNQRRMCVTWYVTSCLNIKKWLSALYCHNKGKQMPKVISKEMPVIALQCMMN